MKNHYYSHVLCFIAKGDLIDKLHWLNDRVAFGDKGNT